MPNENCLRGMRCPKCKSEGPFSISASTWVTVTDDGIQATDDIAWNDNNTCLCLNFDCHTVGKIKDFRTGGA